MADKTVGGSPLSYWDGDPDWEQFPKTDEEIFEILFDLNVKPSAAYLNDSEMHDKYVAWFKKHISVGKDK